ncbi:MAG: hypothetical protein MR473_01045 [Clostridiales bacterium]|nr:hypothetical protein [Clostridiales bacterium]
MKRRWTLALLLALALLAGCVREPAPETVPSTTQATTAPTEGTAPAPDPAYLTQVAGDWIEDMSGISDRVLVLAGFEKGWQELTVRSLPEGALLGVMRLEGIDNQARLLDSGAVVVQTGEGSCLECFDGSLARSLWRWEDPEVLWGQFGTDGDYYAFYGGGLVCRVSLSDGSAAPLETGLAASSLLASHEGRALLSYTDDGGTSRQAWVDWATGEAEPREDSGFSLLSRFGLEQVTQDETRLLRRLGGQEVYTLEGWPDGWIADERDGMALMTREGGLLLWDLRWSKTWSLAAESTCAAVCGDTVVYCDGTGALYLWAYDREEPDTTLAGTWSPSELETQNRAEAAAVHLETGMKVLYGEAGASFQDLGSFGYRGEAQTDPLVIHLALEELLEFTRQYPRGIFREMLTEPVEEIRIFLSGSLSPVDGEGLASASGFTGTGEEVQVLVMNLDYAADGPYFRQTLAHEFMHIMEGRIDACSQEDGISYLSYWESFEPAEDAYYYSYFDETGQELSDPTYTAASGLLPTEVSFLDSYSRSYPHEDRARILEYLYAGQDSPYAYLFQGGEIQAKALYLCAVIRQCFPSCGAASELPWESLVDPVPFQTYEAAVEAYVPQAKG